MFIRLGGVLTLVAVVIWLYAIFDSLTAPADRIRLLPKGLWVVIVLVFADFGALAWLIFGRPRARAGAPVARVIPSPFGAFAPPETRSAPRRSVAPDDDVDFLRHLDDELRRDKPDDDPKP